MALRAIIGDRPPAFPSKATLAAELDMSESTVDSYVKRGILPKPIMMGGCVRWCWAEVVASFKSPAGGDNDKYMTGIDNV